MNDIHPPANVDTTKSDGEGPNPEDGASQRPPDSSVQPLGTGGAGADARGTDARGADALDANVPDADSSCFIALDGGAQTEDPVYIGPGMFMMGAGSEAGAQFPNAEPPHPATVEAFVLDRFEVSVARFRKFVDAYDCWSPSPGDGAISGNKQLGWLMGWGDFLPNHAQLRSNLLTCGGDDAAPTSATWSDTPGDAALENRPINCVTWYEALAFCIWDGGRLPTETEWEYAAANGSEQFVYPAGLLGGPPLPGTANFTPGGLTGPTSDTERATEPFGLQNLQGNVAEWVFDVQSNYGPSLCQGTFCVVSQPQDGQRAVRGGSWSDPPFETFRRTFQLPTDRSVHVGFRCARQNPAQDG